MQNKYLKNQTNQLSENLRTKKYNIWGADLSGMQLIGKFNNGVRFSLCVIGNYSKYAWVIPLRVKKALQLPMLFKKF